MNKISGKISNLHKRTVKKDEIIAVSFELKGKRFSGSFEAKFAENIKNGVSVSVEFDPKDINRPHIEITQIKLLEGSFMKVIYTYIVLAVFISILIFISRDIF